MAQEMEPYKGGVPEWTGTEMPPWFQAPELTTRPEWTELRAPYREDSEVEHYWSNITMPLRALALGFLWISYAWYRAALLLGTIVLIWIVFVAR